MASIFGPSFADQYRYAKRQRDWLKDPDNPYAEEIAANDGDWAAQYDGAMKAQQGSAIAGGILAGLNGLTSIVTNASQAAQINDMTPYEGLIDDVYRSGNHNYNNYDQLAHDYAQSGLIPHVTNDQIRGMSTGQKIGAVGTSALQGGLTGLQVGGLWGGLAGLVIGAGAGLGGVLEGDYKADVEEKYLNNGALTATEVASINRGAAHERIGDNMHRQSTVNVVARGGQLKKQSITDYANKVLSRRVAQERNIPRVTRTKGEGGTIIRFRVK